jgi:hypothetical protein
VKKKLNSDSGFALLSTREIERIATELREEMRRRNGIEWQRKSRGMVGKCFRCPNSYGNKKAWHVFILITKVCEGYYEGLKFQTTIDGEYLARVEKYIEIHDRHTAITRRAFDAAWNKFIIGVSGLNGKEGAQ